MDASQNLDSDFMSVFVSWSSSPEACLLHEASLHAKSTFWNPTFGTKAWILQDYLEYNHIFTQLEMLLKEKVRCILGMNVGISDLKETLAVQEYFIKDLENALLVPNDPLKESRLQAMWKDMENFAKKGIALRETNKVAKVTKGANQATNSHIYTSEKSTKTANDVQSTKIVANENAVKQSEQTLRIKLNILNPIKELPYYWRKSQDKLLKLEKTNQ